MGSSDENDFVVSGAVTKCDGSSKPDMVMKFKANPRTLTDGYGNPFGADIDTSLTENFEGNFGPCKLMNNQMCKPNFLPVWFNASETVSYSEFSSKLKKFIHEYQSVVKVIKEVIGICKTDFSIISIPEKIDEFFNPNFYQMNVEKNNKDKIDSYLLSNHLTEEDLFLDTIEEFSYDDIAVNNKISSSIEKLSMVFEIHVQYAPSDLVTYFESYGGIQINEYYDDRAQYLICDTKQYSSLAYAEISYIREKIKNTQLLYEDLKNCSPAEHLLLKKSLLVCRSGGVVHFVNNGQQYESGYGNAIVVTPHGKDKRKHNAYRNAGRTYIISGELNNFIEDIGHIIVPIVNIPWPLIDDFKNKSVEQILAEKGLSNVANVAYENGCYTITIDELFPYYKRCFSMDDLFANTNMKDVIISSLGFTRNQMIKLKNYQAVIAVQDALQLIKTSTLSIARLLVKNNVINSYKKTGIQIDITFHGPGFEEVRNLRTELLIAALGSIRGISPVISAIGTIKTLSELTLTDVDDLDHFLIGKALDKAKDMLGEQKVLGKLIGLNNVVDTVRSITNFKPTNLASIEVTIVSSTSTVTYSLIYDAVSGDIQSFKYQGGASLDGGYRNAGFENRKEHYTLCIDCYHLLWNDNGILPENNMIRI